MKTSTHPPSAGLHTLFQKFDQLADVPDAVGMIRELILRLAVQGKLVPQDPSDETANKLLERIRQKKGIAKSSITESEALPCPKGDGSKPFEIPSTWIWVRATEPTQSISDLGKKIKTKDVAEKGRFPVIDQGKQFIRGYCDDEEKVIHIETPIVLFGDHTRETKLIDFDFIVGADGVKLLKPIEINPVYYLLALRWLPLDDRGYGRHFKLLRAANIPLPPIAEQKRIVAKVDELMAQCDRLEEQLNERETRQATLARAALALFAASPTPENLKLLFHNSFAVSPSDLRKTILSLAVQGKLVKQDPEDEPASQFVNRLQAERKKAFDELLKIAKQDGIRLPKAPRNEFIACANEDVDGLPNNWCETRVGDVTDCLDYLRIPVNKSERQAAHGTVAYYGANGQVGWIDKHLFDEDLVLVVEDETFIGRVKPFSYVVRGKSWVNNHAHVLRPLGGITSDFLNLVLCQYPFIPLTSGTTARRKLTQPSLMGAKFDLPPLAEQHRIVAKVDQLMALVDALENQITSATNKQTTLLEALLKGV
jgi:type I restriction enzyme S subunit